METDHQNLLRRCAAKPGKSIHAKQLLAAMDESFLALVLGQPD